MIRRFALSLCLLLPTVTAQGEDAPAGGAARWERTFTPAVVSQYLFRGVLLGGPSLQTGLTAAKGDWELGVWSSVPVGHRDLEFADLEIDFSARKSWPLTAAVSLETGVAVYTYPRADLDAGYYRAAVEPVVGLAFTRSRWTITPRLYYDLMAQGPVAEVGVEWALLATPSATLTLAASAGRFRFTDAVNRASVPVRNEGGYWSVGFTAEWTPGPATRITAGWLVMAGEGNYYAAEDWREENTAAVRRGVLSLSWSRVW